MQNRYRINVINDLVGKSETTAQTERALRLDIDYVHNARKTINKQNDLWEDVQRALPCELAIVFTSHESLARNYGSAS